MRDTFEIGHLSDTHLGYEAYRALSPSGNNQRGEDIVRAFVATCRDIIAADPPLVIHAGDATDKTHVPYRYLLVLRQWLQKMAGIRPDGTRRQVVIISGNHDQPHSHKEAASLELFRGIPGLHIVTTKYDVIEFDGTGMSENCDPVLHGVAVHCLPHDVLKTVDFNEVQPIPGKSNVLTFHGVAGGSELYVRSLGREFAIPTDVLSRDWDYVAGGHWHKQGPVGLVSTGASAPEVGRVWYAGSTENMSFRDLRDNGQKRGWLHVTVKPTEVPDVVRKNVPIRTMFRLPHLDMTGKNPEEITAALKENIKNEDVTGAIVGQILDGVTRDVWSLVDMTAVREAARSAMHYEVTVKYASNPTKAEKNGEMGLGDLGTILEEQVRILLTPPEVPPALELAKKLLGTALTTAPAAEDGKDANAEVLPAAATDEAAAEAATAGAGAK